MTARRTKWDTLHDGGTHREGVQYVAPAESVGYCAPTLNDGPKVYFRYKLGAQTVTVECDLSPGFKLGADHRLVEGHVRLYCPMPDCANPLHIDASNKTVFCFQAHTGRDQVFDSAEMGGAPGETWVLPTLTVLEPVACNYRERTDGAKSGCRWRVVIADGRAYDHRPTLVRP